MALTSSFNNTLLNRRHLVEQIRSGGDQLGSGFSSSDRRDPVYGNPAEDSNWPGRR